MVKFLEWPRQTWEMWLGEHGQIFLLISGSLGCVIPELMSSEHREDAIKF